MYFMRNKNGHTLTGAEGNVHCVIYYKYTLMVDKWENKIHFSATVQTFIDMKIML